MKHVFIFFIRLYQKLISPLKPSCCRFAPTCSAYAIHALYNRGFLIGSLLALRRIGRCNPFSRGGYDPVPFGHRFKRIDLIRKKMGEKNGEPSAITVEKNQRKRKEMPFPKWKRHRSKK